jgi:exopolyphosphatase/guanosine-5'-triphosphate,3'-diphosphate pyrophosphatase
MTRVAVVDIGTNSTRLLVADVSPSGTVSTVVRRSTVTRLGAGVDASGSLSSEAIDRVFRALDDYSEEINSHNCTSNLAVLTSAVRDAANGAEFAERIRREYSLDARVLTGEEEAQLTFLGAMHDRAFSSEPTVVIDIGGGSTEFIVGHDSSAGFHVSLPAGVVRMSERHIHSDPPAPSELQNLARDTRAVFLDGLAPEQRGVGGEPITHGIAVAGTATSAASIDQELDPYDPARVQGYPLQLATVELLLARLADMDESQRRSVVGLHPDRAPTIVAGMILLSEALRAFELDCIEVSEHDILFGGALLAAGAAAGAG